MSDAIETQGFLVKIGNQGNSPGELTEVKEVVNFSGFDGQAAEIETTNLQSSAKEFIMGLEDHGQFQIDCNYLPADPGQDEVRAAKAARTLKTVELTFSDSSTATFDCYVLSASLSGGVDSKVDTSFVFRITGSVTYA